MIKRSALHGDRWRIAIATAAALLTATVSAPAQDKKPDTNVARGYSTFDVNFFIGEQWFQFGQGNNAAYHQYGPSVAWGERATEELTKYFGLEQGLMLGYNRLRLLPVGGTTFQSSKAQNTTVYATGELNLTPRESLVRPFIMVGPGWRWFHPSSDTAALTGLPVHGGNSLALVYGVGLKFNTSPRFGVRFDVTGVRSRSPRYGLPFTPGAPGTYWLPVTKGHESSIEATLGLTVRFRYHAPPPPPRPEPCPAGTTGTPPNCVPIPKDNVQIQGVTGARNVCPGEDVRLSVNASGWLPEHTPAYQWMVNGAPAAGGNASSFNVPTTNAGTQSITVKVSAGESSATSNAVSVTVNPLTPPTITFTVNPSTVVYGAQVPLAANANGSQCGGPVTVRYAGQGVTGSTFDSRALNFDQSNRLREQSQTVHLTATATDQKGQTASAGADVRVTLKAEARRLDDVVFPNMSSRVNNCGKRLLLEELTPMLRNDPGAKVILIGHRDANEKGRAAQTLDEQRVENAAAVLSAGQGICPQLDLSRILVNAVGDTENSDTRPALCGSSTNVKERGGAAIRANDTRAQYRRVEVWIVPSGADMPAGLNGLHAAPAAAITAKGCPK
jgi:outer membrane protein OmpA-like peptidoglycan-associated protein